MPKNYHNQGQEDAAAGRFEPPHETIKDLLLTWSSDDLKEHAEENTSYKEGWRHTKDQLDK